jgi:hypothetical protein
MALKKLPPETKSGFAITGEADCQSAAGFHPAPQFLIVIRAMTGESETHDFDVHDSVTSGTREIVAFPH